jgi:hypothetical protein
MSRIIREFLLRQGALLAEDGPQTAVSDYDFPLAVVSPDYRGLMPTPGDFIRRCAEANRHMQGRGVRHLLLDLTAQEMPRNRRFRLWLRYTWLDDDRRPVAGMDAICHCRDHGHRLCVEMVEYLAKWGTAVACDTSVPPVAARAAR